MIRPLKSTDSHKVTIFLYHKCPLSIIRIYREPKEIFFKAGKALLSIINLIKLNYYQFTFTGSALGVFTGFCSYMLLVLF